jgi:hypothetical protein
MSHLFGMFFFAVSISLFAQTKDDIQKKQENNLKGDTVNIDLKNISTQLINLRDSIGVEMMAMDKRLIRASEPSQVALEKTKCSLSIYRSELEKLIEELTMADVSYITDTKRRAYRAVVDIRKEFLKTIAQSKDTIKG